MRVITIPSEETTLNELCQQSQQTSLILQVASGQRFVLAAIDENWEGFEVGSTPDFAQEVRATEQNEDLFKFLAQRRSRQKRTPLSEVKKQLGLEKSEETVRKQKAQGGVRN